MSLFKFKYDPVHIETLIISIYVYMLIY